MTNPFWRRLIVATVLCMVMVPMLAVPTQAYQIWGPKWPSDLVTVCVDTTDFTSVGRRGVIFQAAAQWDSASSELLVNYVAQSDCGSHDITVRKGELGGTPAQTNPVASRGAIIDADVVLDHEYTSDELWWGTVDETQQCYVGVGGASECKPDAFTIFAHELGHAFGLTHLYYPDEKCTAGWFSTNTAQACSNGGGRTMSWEAGIEKQQSNADESSGYRHASLYSDDVDGINFLFNTN